MLNHKLARTAFRNRAVALSVATTGTISLSATATGYARASGSFITDGFLVGMEVVPTGFTQTTYGIITGVTALALTIEGGRTVQASSSGRTLTVGLPLLRAWENTAGLTLSPTRPYIVEQWVPATAAVTTMPSRIGNRHETGLSIWNWYGIAGVGTDALDAQADALLARFATATEFTLSDGAVVKVRGNPAPSRSQSRTIDGWSVVTITVPWQVNTRNAVAA